MKRSHLISIFIGLFLLVGLFVYREQRETQSNTNVHVQPMVKTWTDETISQKNPQDKSNIQVVYPQFTGLTDKATEETINSSILDLMDTQIADFKKGISPNPLLPSSMQNVTNDLVIESNVVRADDSIVSVLFQIMQAYPGQAHPENFNLTFNYDVAGKRVLSIADIFKPGTDFVDTLSKESQDVLLKEPAISEDPNAKDFVNEGAGPQESNFTLFTLSDEDLTIIFNPATVAPDFAGTIAAPISYSKLSSILNHNLSL